MMARKWGDEDDSFGFGPNQGKRRYAWGATRVDVSSEQDLGPKIVRTPKSAAKYPKNNATNDSFVDDGEKRAKSGCWEKAKERTGQRKKAVQLSSSTMRPKPRPKPRPPKTGIWKQKEAVIESPFKLLYDRGDIPACIGHGAKRRVHWKCVLEDLDYHHYLPIFFEGLRETREPYTFLAHQGVTDLLRHGGNKVLPVVPQLVLPIKAALNTRDRRIICKIFKVLQSLVKSGPYVGEALVPYYRQILPVFNMILLLEKRANLGDQIDYGQRKRENLVDLAYETLEMLQETGGEDAYINIKYMVPMYESQNCE